MAWVAFVDLVFCILSSSMALGSGADFSDGFIWLVALDTPSQIALVTQGGPVT